LLSQLNGLKTGHNIRAMVYAYDNGKDYLSNWDGIDLSNTKYLLDKSIINPDKYNYHIQDWRNYQHKMIFMIRNIYDVLKSHFLATLAGEEDYATGKIFDQWDIDNITEKDIDSIMSINKHKYLHYHVLSNLPKDVFDKDRNMFFCSFEDVKNNEEVELHKLENFIGIKFNSYTLPHLNKTESRYNNFDLYKKALNIFNEYKDMIYSKYINYDEWEWLCNYTNIDFISKYNIKEV